MPDPQTIAAALRARPELASISDADAAAALSEPVYTPRSDRVTYTTLGDTWGVARAAEFRAALLSLPAPMLAVGQYVSSLLAGNGFDATSPKVAATVEQLVAAKICTADEVRSSLFTSTYPAGAPVTADDIAAARAAMTFADAARSLRADLAGIYNRGVAAIDAGEASGQLPSLDALRGG